jgi:ABC-type uncharacterized transport system auxiliary subunit
VAAGPVATASPAWYWEGAPPRVLSEGLARRLGCLGAAVVPDRASARPDLLLTGRLERFEVQREPAGGAGPRFELAVRLELWTGDGRMLMSDRRIEAAEGMREVTDRAVAVAAQAALDRFLAEAAAWAGEALRSR